ncbi:MAG: hypothetical protein QW666_00160 [Candidatus Woesearchaeota archaeon]
MALEIAPLKTSFMLAGILGFMISVIYLPKYSLNFAFAFGLVFLLMIIAALFSMTKESEDIMQLHVKKRK